MCYNWSGDVLREFKMMKFKIKFILLHTTFTELQDLKLGKVTCKLEGYYCNRHLFDDPARKNIIIT